MFECRSEILITYFINSWNFCDSLGLGHSIVASLVQNLLNRCKSEGDPETRLALAICLGEIGAIDPNRLSEDVNSINKISSSISCLDPNSAISKWRLQNPPWKLKSTHVKYMLKLLTNHLVTALKSSTTPLELNKISFAIQEILTLTNQCSNDISSNEQNTDFSNVENVEKNIHGVMNKWLEGILKKEGVYEDLETFWESDFQQVRVFISYIFIKKETEH